MSSPKSPYKEIGIYSGKVVGTKPLSKSKKPVYPQPGRKRK